MKFKTKLDAPKKSNSSSMVFIVLIILVYLSLGFLMFYTCLSDDYCHSRCPTYYKRVGVYFDGQIVECERVREGCESTTNYCVPLAIGERVNMTKDGLSLSNYSYSCRRSNPTWFC